MHSAKPILIRHPQISLTALKILQNKGASPKGADVDFHRKDIRATKPLASQSASLLYRTEEKEVWDCAKCSSHRKDLGLRYSGSSSHHNDSLSLGAGAGRRYFGNLVIHSIKF